MSEIIQCVPNFSEGRRPEVVRDIALALGSGGAKVVDYSFDEDHNRSVITIIGDSLTIRKSVIEGVTAAIRLIDMRTHTGAHPRIGAVDVIPLIPVRDVTMDDCLQVAQLIGRDLAEDLQIPVFFYEESAARPDRRNLSDIRKGGYERLSTVELQGDLAPDMGPNRLHQTAGATAVGARGPLIAFNIDLLSNDMELARNIASTIRRNREEGRGFQGVKAIAVKLASKGIVQISTNITRPEKVTMFDVYEFVRQQASEAGVTVLRSELIGMARLDACARSLGQALQLGGFHQEKTLDYWLAD